MKPTVEPGVMGHGVETMLKHVVIHQIAPDGQQRTTGLTVQPSLKGATVGAAAGIAVGRVVAQAVQKVVPKSRAAEIAPLVGVTVGGIVGGLIGLVFGPKDETTIGPIR